MNQTNNKPRTEIIREKRLVGKCRVISFTNNETFELWKGFMPRRKEIKNSIGIELISAEVYKPGFFNPFHPEAEFQKWAVVEVTDFNDVPAGMETLTTPAGLYAVFLHKGPDSKAEETYQYIFREWLPGSRYSLDDRPHFAVMGANYRKEDPDSEEEIFIPVREKVEGCE